MELSLIIICVWILSTCFHEFGHAITAYVGGDKSVKDKGYLTLNPIVYFNSATTLVIPVLALMIGGIPLPGAAVSINYGKIKNRFMQSLVSFAGPFFTFIVLVALSILLQFLPQMHATMGDAQYDIVLKAVSALIYLHIFVFMLNLIPLPPLDGFGILEPWLPKSVQQKAKEYSNLGFAFLIFLFWFCDPFSFWMSLIAALTATVIGVDYDNDVRAGLHTVKDNSIPLIAVIILVWIIKNKIAPPQEKADKLLLKGNYAEALPLYDQALAKQQDPRVAVASATCLLNLGRKEEALQRVNNAISLEPENPQAQGIKAACLAESGQFEEAVQASDSAIKYDTNTLYPFIYFVKASSLNQLGRYAEALDAAEIYLKREAKNPEGLFVKANSLENLDRYDEAIAVYDKAARLSPASNLRAGLAKGILLCALGRISDGLAEFDKFLPKKEDKRREDLNNLALLLEETAKKLDEHGKNEMATQARRAVSQLR